MLAYQIKGEISRIGYCQKNDDYWTFLRKIFTEIIIANIKKANKIQCGYYNLNINELRIQFNRLELTTILQKQNISSADINGFVWVLNTCVFLVAAFIAKRFGQMSFPCACRANKRYILVGINCR